MDGIRLFGLRFLFGLSLLLIRFLVLVFVFVLVLISANIRLVLLRHVLRQLGLYRSKLLDAGQVLKFHRIS